tara:strand:+ start:1074 stop:1205 length:132 start_codon:yes stop_codon:yes gene_type:complete
MERIDLDGLLVILGFVITAVTAIFLMAIGSSYAIKKGSEDEKH